MSEEQKEGCTSSEANDILILVPAGTLVRAQLLINQTVGENSPVKYSCWAQLRQANKYVNIPSSVLVRESCRVRDEADTVR
jgi:hypothetical protein